MNLDELQKLGELGWTTEIMSRDEINKALKYMHLLIAVARLGESIIENDDGHGGADCQIAEMGRALAALKEEK